MDDLVSIIMPSYNTAEYIEETINSVLQQNYQNWELIIVDDYSSDNTDEVIKKFLEDNRIHYLKNEKNSGAAVSRNRALREAKGKWIAFLDSDDVWLPEKLEKQINFMAKNNYKFSYTSYEEIDESSKDRGIYITGPKHVSKLAMNIFCWQGCLTVMYDVDAVGLLQIADIKKNNDYAMWLKVIKQADCYLLDEYLAKYRVREKSISHGFSKFGLVKHHYIMWEEAECKNCFDAWFWTLINIVGAFWKKWKYVKTK